MGWPLVGREAEFARVTNGFAPGSGLLIIGEPGVGKTRLARVGLDAAYAKGARIEWVAGAAGAAGVPLSAIAHLIPDDAGDQRDPSQLLRAMARTLVAPAYGSLVLGLDDAHAIDDASAAVLHHAVVSGNASLVATARRGHDLPEPIAGLVREGRLERLDVPPLTDVDVETLLVASLGGPVDGGTLEQLCAASKGNPMLLRELVHAGLETSALEQHEGLWVWNGPFTAPRLTDLVDARLARLSAAERAGLETIAVTAPLPLDVAESVVGVDVLAALDRAELLETRATAAHPLLQLAHPLYGEVLRATTSWLQRRAAQLDVAESFVALGHLSRADLLRVVTWRLEAGATNERGHLHAAAQRALSASEFELAERIARSDTNAGDDDTSRSLLAMALAGQGRIDDAHDVLAAEDDEQRSAALIARTVDTFFYGSRTTKAAAAVERVRQVIDDTTHWPEGSEPLVEAARAGVLLLAGTIDEACSVAARVIEHPTAPAVAKLRAILVAGPGAAIAGRTTDAIRDTNHGISLIAGGTSPSSAATDALVELDAEPLLPATLSMAARIAGNLTKAIDLAYAEYQSALAVQSRPAQGLFALALGQALLTQGRVEQALQRLREAVPLLRRPPSLMLGWALGYLGQAAASVGDLATAKSAVVEGDAQRSDAFQLFDCDLDQAKAWILAAEGNLGDASRTALTAARAAAEAGQYAFAAQASYDAARIDGDKAAAALLTDIEHRVDGRLTPAFARHAEAIAAGDPTLLLTCADRFEELGAELFAAEAAAAAARRLEAKGHSGQARAAAIRARTLAGPSGRVVTPAMRDLGRGPTLSRREAEIARLAAAGMSNRAIAAQLHVSVRTVDNHLHHTYEKLGISSRTELANSL